jgi:hypothetical protein
MIDHENEAELIHEERNFRQYRASYTWKMDEINQAARTCNFFPETQKRTLKNKYFFAGVA